MHDYDVGMTAENLAEKYGAIIILTTTLRHVILLLILISPYNTYTLLFIHICIYTYT